MASYVSILLVEDDDIIRESLAETLEDEGYGVASAANGQQALDWLRANPAPRLILLDIYMPVMSGTEFRQRQLDDPALAVIPVIVLSAVAPDRVAALRPQVFLQKPPDLDVLLEVVKRFC